MTMTFLALIVLALLTHDVSGHGRLLEPPSRSSMWRFGYGTPANYNDNQLFCGGRFAQWGRNAGRCGVCGDPWDGPRENEAGGKYAKGIITRTYTEGQTINIKVQVTASHHGYFEFRLCPHNSPSTPVRQSCLDANVLRQPNGETRFKEKGLPVTYELQLVLPEGITCSQCLLQWKWNTGNSYGCDGAHCCIGCGHQEQFYGCSDIKIDPSSHASNSQQQIHTSFEQNQHAPQMGSSGHLSGYNPPKIIVGQMFQPHQIQSGSSAHGQQSSHTGSTFHGGIFGQLLSAHHQQSVQHSPNSAQQQQVSNPDNLQHHVNEQGFQEHLQSISHLQGTSAHLQNNVYPQGSLSHPQSIVHPGLAQLPVHHQGIVQQPINGYPLVGANIHVPTSNNQQTIVQPQTAAHGSTHTNPLFSAHLLQGGHSNGRPQKPAVNFVHGGFIPIHAAVQTGSGRQVLCKATVAYKVMFPNADTICQEQCRHGRCLPAHFCNEACRNM